MRIWKIKTESMRGHKSEYLFKAKNITELKKAFIKRYTEEYYNDIKYIECLGDIENGK